MTLSPTDIKRLDSKNADKNIPLLIKCSNENKKWELIRASKNLKLQDKENLKIWTTPDCTIQEREERKRLIKAPKA